MKVSVVIPVYNGSNYLGKAIESVLNQDYPDIELIVCDGESKDNTREIAESYGVKVVQGKLGLMPNWSVAINSSNGDYLKLLCHDDTLRKDCISKQVQILDAKPEVSLVSCQRQYIGPDGENRETRHPITSTVQLSGRDASSLMMKYGNIIGETTCTLFRNKKITFPDNLNWLLDMYLWMRFLTEGDLYFIGEPLANIRQHPDQDTFRVLKDPEYGAKETSDKQHLLDIYMKVA